MKRITLIIISVAVTAFIAFSVLPVLSGGLIDDAAMNDVQAYQSSHSVTAENVDSPYSVKAGRNLSFTLSATDPDNDYLVYSASNLPSGATFDSQTGEFSWTPGYDQAGIYNVHFEVSDGSLTDSEDITITVYDAYNEPETKQNLISVSSLKITPSKANIGKKINISVTVTNNGDSTGEYEVILMINGVTEGSKTTTLAAGAAQNVRFFTSKEIPGTYQVDVNGLTDSFIVVEQTKGNSSSKPSR